MTPRTVPTAPAEVTAVPGNGSIDVAWAAPASDGGSPVTGYTAVASPGGATCSTTTLGCTVGGLTNGVGYTLTVTATNVAGTSPASTPSGSVTPVGPIAPPTADVVTVEPGRFLDTRPTGDTIDDQFLGAGKLQADTFTRIQIAGRGGVADDAVGVEVNITAIQNEGPRLRHPLPLHPRHHPPPPPSTTHPASTSPTPPPSPSTPQAKSASTPTPPPTTPSTSSPTSPQVPTSSTVEPGRLLDTRTDGSTVDGQFLGAGKLPAGQTIKVQIAGRGGVADDAVGVEVNITAIQNEGRGFATLYPCTPDTTHRLHPQLHTRHQHRQRHHRRPQHRRRNLPLHQHHRPLRPRRPRLRPRRIRRRTVEPGRLLDTRTDGSTIDDQFQGAGKVQADTFTRIQIAGRGGVADDAVGVEVNITAIQNEGRGFATLYPCTPDIPTASTLNYTPGINIANATTVALNTAGEICLYTNTTAHYALDIVAHIAAT